MASPVRRMALACTLVPAAAFTLAGCTQTVDKKSAENVISSNIGKLGPLKATSVSCPDDVPKKNNTSFNCQVSLLNTSNHATAKATITLHITSAGNRAVFSASDIHVR